MFIVTAICGADSDKIVNGKRKKTVPFVGADREGEFAQMGVGLGFPDDGKGIIWGLVIPHNVIQSWRGMKILEQVERFENYTLADCWNAAGQTIHTSDGRCLYRLAEQLGGADDIETLREKVLASVPTIDELTSMIEVFRKHNVEISASELEAEVVAGRLPRLPIIETVKRDEEIRRQAREERLAARKANPEPPSETAFVPKAPVGLFARIAAWF